MNKTRITLSILLFLFLFSCTNGDTSTKISPYNDLSKIDEILKSISQKPQIFFVPSDRSSKVIGDNGTIIHVDPIKLQTEDGSPISDSIRVELLEFTDKYSLITNNVQTLSDNDILITGGAYYINMTSKNKQLKIIEGKGIEVEFSKLSDDEMALFLGERDSMGQVNWIPTQQKFIAKNPKNPKKPDELESEKSDSASIVLSPLPDEYDILLDSVISAPKEVKKGEVSEEEYQRYLLEMEIYNKRLIEIDNLKKTYQVIEILNFGLINCDRFYENPNPRTNIELTFNSDSIISARFFAVFEDINSILTENYWLNKQEKTQFKNIPVDMKIKIIGLTVRDSIPFWFFADIKTSLNQSIKVEFIETTQKQLQENLRHYIN